MRWMLLLLCLACSSPPKVFVPLPPSPASVPAPVVADAELSMVSAAVDAWNEAAGCRVFMYVGSAWREPWVRVTAEGVFEQPGTTYTVLRRGDTSCGRAGCQVRIFNLGREDSVIEYLTEVHELGHVLGLDHDEWKTSVMNGMITHTLNSDGPMPWIQPGAADFVHQRFCKEPT